MAPENAKTNIMRAVERLLSDKRIEDLSVTRICEEAHVSRHTFYRYFRDKYDASNQILDSTAKGCMAFVGRTISFREALIMSLCEFKKSGSLMKNTSFDDDYNAMPRVAYRELYPQLRDMIVHHKGVALTEELDFQLETFLVGVNYQIHRWIQRDMPQAPERLADLIVSTAPPQILRLLQP